MNRDHIILQFHHNNELLTVSNFASELSYHAEVENSISTLGKYYLDERKSKKLDNPIIAKQYLDQRRGYITLFKFCPNYGEKINWKQIKRNLV